MTYDYRTDVEMLIWGIRSCIDDDFSKFYENDILNWIDALSDIRRKMQDSISTKNEVSNTLYKEEPKVDSTLDTHSQIQEIMDKDYKRLHGGTCECVECVKDKQEVRKC